MKARALTLLASTWLIPRYALACPMCVGQQSGGVARVVALGLMILLPFFIAYVVFRALRRAAVPAAESSRCARAEADRDGEAMRELSL